MDGQYYLKKLGWFEVGGGYQGISGVLFFKVEFKFYFKVKGGLDMGMMRLNCSFKGIVLIVVRRQFL